MTYMVKIKIIILILTCGLCGCITTDKSFIKPDSLWVYTNYDTDQITGGSFAFTWNLNDKKGERNE